jgi:hypothetical protein
MAQHQLCNSTNIEKQQSTPRPGFEADLHLIGKLLGVGFFCHGPRLWMVGEVEPLKALQDPTTRTEVIARILTEYPATEVTSGQLFVSSSTKSSATQSA